MQVTAKARFIRTGPRKVRAVIDVVRGKDVAVAKQQLVAMRQEASTVVKKLVDSAVANAEHNFGLQANNLYIATIKADEGPTLKRWTPRAFGRATTIRKRSCHITIVLDERIPTEPKVGRTSTAAAPVTLTATAEAGDKGKTTGKRDAKPTSKGAGRSGKRGFSQKLFSRKAG